jgi:hypothetical protein
MDAQKNNNGEHGEEEADLRNAEMYAARIADLELMRRVSQQPPSTYLFLVGHYAKGLQILCYLISQT